MTQLCVVKRGRKLALGETLDAEVKHYIKRLYERMGPLSALLFLVQAAAEDYLYLVKTVPCLQNTVVLCYHVGLSSASS